MHLKRQIRFLQKEFREHRTRTVTALSAFHLVWIPMWRLMNAVVGGKELTDGMHSSGLLAIIETSCLLGGPLSVAAGIYNWDWYFTSDQARPFVNLFGRPGTRIFYIIIGFGLSLIALIGLIFPALGYVLLFQDLFHH